MKLKNLAIVAHVDHGKTTMVDGLLHQSGTFGEREEVAERVMDSGDIERERGITITAKNCSFAWKGVKINLLDTPGHADFGGEVERSLMMVDGIILLVDAAEGPLPQTRFVLQKALERHLKLAVVINKVDRHDARIDEVKSEVEDLLLELASILEIEIDLDIPFLFASGRDGWCSHSPEVKTDSLSILHDLMASEYFPSPKINEGVGLQMLVTNLSYNNYLGALVVGRIQRGEVLKHGNVMLMGEDGINKVSKIANIQVYSGLKQTEVNRAEAGEIVILAGIEGARIGDTISDPQRPEALPRIYVEPPTVAVSVSVNTSPLSSREGEYLTSRKLEELLQDACRLNVSLSYAPTDDPKVFVLKGRGELQLAIVFEEIRRKGFEFMVSRPEVLFRTDENGQQLEPFENLVLDLPEESTGTVTQKLAERKGVMTKLVPLGEGRTRMEFCIPSRGLIGYRSVFLTDTRGAGLMSSLFLGYRPSVGKMLARTNGAVISDRTGKTTTYALFNLLNSGPQFVKVGADVYEGMIIGEHTRGNDLNVNCVREKHVSSVRTAGKDENMILPPVTPRSLEWAMDWIDDDELVEVTPINIRVRKKILKANDRSVIR